MQHLDYAITQLVVEPVLNDKLSNIICAFIVVVVGDVEVYMLLWCRPSLTQPGRSWRAWESESGRDPSVYGRFYADGTTCPRFD